MTVLALDELCLDEAPSADLLLVPLDGVDQLSEDTVDSEHPSDRRSRFNLLLDVDDLDIAEKKMYDNRQSDYDAASRIDRIRNTAHLPRCPSQTHSLCCLPQR